MLNSYEILGAVVCVDVSTPSYPNHFATIDVGDLALVLDTGPRWFASCTARGIYSMRRRGGETASERMHRLIVCAPLGFVVDHINGDTLDNRRSNLRLATIADNSRNRRAAPSGSSKFRGVSWDPKNLRWKSQITFNKKNRTLGRFLSEEDAARAYDAAAREFFGAFANPNFPEIVT